MHKNRIDPLLVQPMTCVDEVLTLHSKAELTLVFVLEGNGMTQFDAQVFPYQQGKLFVIPFSTTYRFESQQRSRFLVI